MKGRQGVVVTYAAVCAWRYAQSKFGGENILKLVLRGMPVTMLPEVF